MILNSFKLRTAIIQIQYHEAFEIWDHAGEITSNIYRVWPGLTVAEGVPNQQTLQGDGVKIETGFTQSTITLSDAKPLSRQNVQRVAEVFDIWREVLNLHDLPRISTRVIYVKEFPTLKDAQAELIGLNLVRWPDVKVFDQEMGSDLNGYELVYKFNDEQSFSTLRLKVEQLKYKVQLDPYFVDQTEIESTRNRMIIDFDRGLLKPVKAGDLRIDNWIKGFQHVLNRDIDKVIRAS